MTPTQSRDYNNAEESGQHDNNTKIENNHHRKSHTAAARTRTGSF
jgi:hypothetical protein